MIDFTFAEALHEKIKCGSEALFSNSHWPTRVLRHAAMNREFMNALLFFTDVYPVLDSDDALVDHIQQYFGGLTLPSDFHEAEPGDFRQSMRDLFSLFVAGTDLDEAIGEIGRLSKSGYAYSLDMLGEATLSEQEARAYLDGQTSAILAIHEAGYPVHITLKPSSLYSQMGPLNFQRSVDTLADRLSLIVEQAADCKGFVHVDMEQRQFQSITLAAFRELINRYPNNEMIGIAIQSYLKDSEAVIRDLIDFARTEQRRFTVRLVKGAYHDWERILADQNNWPCPVWEQKWQTDVAYERNLALLLGNSSHIFTAAATHNLRTASLVKGLAKKYGVDRSRYEFQMLYGMGSSMASGLRDLGETVRLYLPFGSPVPGMAYLVRRLVENTAAEGAVRSQFLYDWPLKRLLAEPQSLIVSSEPDPVWKAGTAGLTGGQKRGTTIRNHPPADFSLEAVRCAFYGALDTALIQMQNGRDVTETDPGTLDSIISRASLAQHDWEISGVHTRAGIMEEAAGIMASRIFELAALQVREVGKQWDQAYNDICEAIDFLRYYADQARGLFNPSLTAGVWGEENFIYRRARGVYAVIAPWNFPMAISCGMVSAALVTGNAVLYKPAEESAGTGKMLWEILLEAGVPPEILHFLPGPGETLGAALVRHRGIQGIAFTGSREVGLDIIAACARPAEGSRNIKACIAEMGGKNAIIVDEDADIDTAVEAALVSAFGFQGQKCSAASRIIVMKRIYPEFRRRLVEAAESLHIGDACNPANRVGPLVSEEADNKLRRYLDIARTEGRGLLYRHPLAIFEVDGMDRRICREEVFAPLLVIMPAGNLDEAIAMANDVEYGLTAGIISRNPANIQEAVARFEAGNIYVNRGITGAIVGRQPFGGYKLSGVGAKAGGPDYLSQFVNTVHVSRNLVRRGYSPG